MVRRKKLMVFNPKLKEHSANDVQFRLILSAAVRFLSM